MYSPNNCYEAEEKLIADLAEATYNAYLDKLKERTQDVDMLDLSKIHNIQRGIPSSDSNPELGSKKMGSQKKGEKEKMKIMLWNMRGFGRPTRRTQVKKYMKKENLDGIGLLETIRESFTQKELDDLARGSSFRWV
jgi:hypothetical protein